MFCPRELTFFAYYCWGKYGFKPTILIFVQFLYTARDYRSKLFGDLEIGQIHLKIAQK